VKKRFTGVLPTRWRRKPAGTEITSLSPYVYRLIPTKRRSYRGHRLCDVTSPCVQYTCRHSATCGRLPASAAASGAPLSSNDDRSPNELATRHTTAVLNRKQRDPASRSRDIVDVIAHLTYHTRWRLAAWRTVVLGGVRRTKLTHVGPG